MEKLVVRMQMFPGTAAVSSLHPMLLEEKEEQK